MFKVVIDVTCIDDRPSGVGLYTLNLIQALSNLQSVQGFQLGICYQSSLKAWLKGKFKLPDCLQPYSPRYELPLPVRTSNICVDRFPQFFPWVIEPFLDSPDIIHGTNYTVFPYQNPLKVMNIYDLTYIKYPDYVDAMAQQYPDRIRKCLTWTDLVITISESSKQDIVRYFQFPPEKIWITPLASRYSQATASHLMMPRAEDFQSIYDFSKPYLLFVSTLEPRKNITTLIQAFNHLKSNHKIEHHLVLIGRKGWKYDGILAAIEDSVWREAIHHLDYLPDDQVAWFYQQADVFVYPSHYEGFGLPVLEAMNLGAPVVTSNTSSLPEVVGDAALLVSPQDYLQLADAILRVIDDRPLRSTLIEKGKQQAAKFSWQKTAQSTLEAYQSLL